MRKQTGTKFYLNERKIEAVNAQKPGFRRKLVTTGKASACEVTMADGTRFTMKPTRTKRESRKVAKLAAFAVQTRNRELLAMCGTIGDSNH